METGEIKSLRFDRGFAFIARDGGKGDVFAHCRDFAIPFTEQLLHQRVKFAVIDSPKGPRAIEVSAI